MPTAAIPAQRLSFSNLEGTQARAGGRTSCLDARPLFRSAVYLYETVAQIAYATRGSSMKGPVLCPRTNQVFPDG